ncbi:MAG: MTAP family purine nucleoside phosphorylase [Verrucomicrobiota bacterium]
MIAFIVGSGFYELEGFSPVETVTRFGNVRYLTGKIAENPVLLLPRHGSGHTYLPHQINHRANLLALKEAGAERVVSCSVCGVINPDWSLGAPLVAKELFFPENRLGDGTTCTVFQEPAEPGRGHLLAGSFFHSSLSSQIESHFKKSHSNCHIGSYAHANGPRFNSKAEIKALRVAGADFLSQTCGPEAVLANELELPYALAGFSVDYANGVQLDPTPVETLQANLKRAKDAFVDLIQTLSSQPQDYTFENFVYRFD